MVNDGSQSTEDFQLFFIFRPELEDFSTRKKSNTNSPAASNFSEVSFIMYSNINMSFQ